MLEGRRVKREAVQEELRGQKLLYDSQRFGLARTFRFSGTTIYQHRSVLRPSLEGMQSDISYLLRI